MTELLDSDSGLISSFFGFIVELLWSGFLWLLTLIPIRSGINITFNLVDYLFPFVTTVESAAETLFTGYVLLLIFVASAFLFGYVAVLVKSDYEKYSPAFWSEALDEPKLELCPRPDLVPASTFFRRVK